MSSNAFGNLFKITTWGESHGIAIGVVIDGCPAGLALTESDIQHELNLRMPGKNKYTSPRQESDQARIYSGVFEGQTTGAPISIIIYNQDADSSKYEEIKNLLRPGHANYTYLQKYGTFDYRGGGRASARETACRVAAGAVAKKLLRHYGILVCAYLSAVADCSTEHDVDDIEKLRTATYESPIFCPNPHISTQMMEIISTAKENKDSLGGKVSFLATGIPAGLGDPVYEKLEANLAKAMMSLPATKAFEIGSGFQSVLMNGSEHNDIFIREASSTTLKTNFAGGTLGGISNGMPLYGSVAFKPTSSIAKTQQTLTLDNQVAAFTIPEGSRHDPCVAIRAVPIVEAMCALVLADAYLMNRSAKL